MNFSFRTARNLGLFILLVIIVIESIFAYISMSDSSERLTVIIKVDQVKLRRWYDVSEIIAHAKDSLYDYRLGRTDVVASVDLLVNKAIGERPSMLLKQRCRKGTGADRLPGKWRTLLSGKQTG